MVHGQQNDSMLLIHALCVHRKLPQSQILNGSSIHDTLKKKRICLIELHTYRNIKSILSACFWLFFFFFMTITCHIFIYSANAPWLLCVRHCVGLVIHVLSCCTSFVCLCVFAYMLRCLKEDPATMSLLQRSLDPEKTLGLVDVLYTAVFDINRWKERK